MNLGEELCIKYIDVNVPRSSRREKLWDDYRFLCLCVRCEKEQDKHNVEKITYNQSKNHSKKQHAPKKKIKPQTTKNNSNNDIPLLNPYLPQKYINSFNQP